MLEEGQFASFDPEIYHAQQWLEILHKPTVERFYTTIPQPGLYGKEADIPRAMVCQCYNFLFFFFIYLNPEDLRGNFFQRNPNLNV